MFQSATAVINAYLKKHEISVRKLARLVGTTSQNLGKRLKQDSIDTGLLTKICEALGHNFYAELAAKASPDAFSVMADGIAQDIMPAYLIGEERRQMLIDQRNEIKRLDEQYKKLEQEIKMMQAHINHN